ncbi:LPS-assembly protein LptD [Trinickia terrae]|uniref:LPS-assembly protein LptD n=1 Tax=Trinickia terrae TaxID=2571161 RepID=A0A4U1HWF9_9BURK|nr:LPS-assembly protein LptD [Trinickia terrae]TKC86045.1 LPS-assembly protein LptD [Trinickia terrae]
MFLFTAPGLWPACAGAQLTGDAAGPQQLDGPWGLRLAPQIGEEALRPGDRPAVAAIANQATGTEDTDLSLKGAAELRRYDSVTTGASIHYDVDSDLVDGYGDVHLTRNGESFAGPEAHFRIDANEGYMSVPKYRFVMTGGWGSAQRADLLDAERSVLLDGTYSTCQCTSRPAWYVKASRLDIDNGSNEAVAHNGVLFFQDLPILASPWLSFPLSDARLSGLLPPTMSIGSTNGVDLALPYYFNIAPNYDLTVTPRIMTKRGEALSADYRFLTPSNTGEIALTYLPNDAIAKTNRYSITVNDHWNLGSGFGAYVNYNRVSDSAVETDLGAGTVFPTSSTTLYQQEAGLTYGDGPWSVLARVEHWQSFSSSLPYNREPQVNVQYNRYNIGGFDFGAEADASRFTTSTADATQGNRFVFNPWIDYAIVHPGWYVTPKLQWHFASYDLTSIGSDAPSGQPKVFNVNVPTFTLDSGMTFERSVRLFGQSYIQTLEPRLYYVYTPYRNQLFAPVFDTAEADFGLAEIYTPNSFVGNDRIADANRLTAGLTTRFIDPASGDERARFVIAQQYEFRTPRVTLVDDESIADVARTGLILGASYKIAGNVAAEQAVQYSEANDALTHAVAGFSWKPAPGKVLNFAYRYTRATATLDDEPVNQFVVSSQWPLAHNISGVGRVNYDMRSHHLIAGLAGLQYDAQCWSVALALEKYTYETSSSTLATGTRVLMQLQLKGVSKIDNGLLEQFKADVPGYTSPAADTAPLSRFSDYP